MGKKSILEENQEVLTETTKRLIGMDVRSVKAEEKIRIQRHNLAVAALNTAQFKEAQTTLRNMVDTTDVVYAGRKGIKIFHHSLVGAADNLRIRAEGRPPSQVSDTLLKLVDYNEIDYVLLLKVP